MEAFQFSVALRIVRAGQHMGRLPLAHELLEVLGHELRSIVRDNPGTSLGKFLPRPLENDLSVFFFHRLPDYRVGETVGPRRP